MSLNSDCVAASKVDGSGQLINKAQNPTDEEFRRETAVKEAARSAIKRLESHLYYIENKEDLTAIKFLLGKKIPFLHKKIEKVLQVVQKAQAGKGQKNGAALERFASNISQCQSLILSFRPEYRNSISSLLKELSALRWKINPNQRFYNLDAEYLRLTAKAKSMGIGV